MLAERKTATIKIITAKGLFRINLKILCIFIYNYLFAQSGDESITGLLLYSSMVKA